MLIVQLLLLLLSCLAGEKAAMLPRWRVLTAAPADAAAI